MALPSPNFITKHDVKHKISKQHQNQHELKKSSNFNYQKKYTFDCKVCSLKFSSQNDLFTHRNLHETCPHDGCMFNALENIVTAHFQRAHITHSKIQDLSTPEDIEKWREERRKRYPTVANVILRQQIKQDKMERGENIQKAKNKRFGDVRQRNFSSNHDKHQRKQHNNNRNERNQNFKRTEVKLEHQVKDNLVEETEEKVRATPKFQGFSKPEIKVQSGLSLIGDYGSDSESNEEQIEESPRKIIKQPICIANDDDEEPIEEKIEKNQYEDDQIVDIAPPKPRNNGNLKRKSKTTGPLLDYSKLRRTSANPLLEKLLQSDIEHERNVILQCCRFIVKNNFFDLEDNKT
jgi:nuclear fragile X mental retardation-interacting protein 1